MHTRQGEKNSLQFWCIYRCRLGTAGCQGRREDHLSGIGGSQHPLLPITCQRHWSNTTWVWMYVKCDMHSCLLRDVEPFSVSSPRRQLGRRNSCFQDQTEILMILASDARKASVCFRQCHVDHSSWHCVGLCDCTIHHICNKDFFVLL